MSSWNEQATSEVVDRLRSEGLEIDGWELLGESNRLVLQLKPLGIIVKIARPDAVVQMARELAVAAHVVARGGPAGPPASARAVQLTDNTAFSLWERLTPVGEPSPTVVCAAYDALRTSLDSFQSELPDFRKARSACVEPASLHGAPSARTRVLPSWKRLAIILERWKPRNRSGDGFRTLEFLTSSSPAASVHLHHPPDA